MLLLLLLLGVLDDADALLPLLLVVLPLRAAAAATVAAAVDGALPLQQQPLALAARHDRSADNKEAAAPRCIPADDRASGLLLMGGKSDDLPRITQGSGGDWIERAAEAK